MITAATPVAAVQAYLASLTAVVDAVSADATGPYIFQYDDFRGVKGTGNVALVISANGSWTTPNQNNTMQFPRILVEAYADVSRDPTTHDMTRPDGQEKAQILLQVVTKVLHRPQGGGLPGVAVGADGLRVLGSLRLGEPTYPALPDGDGVIVGTVDFGLVVA